MAKRKQKQNRIEIPQGSSKEDIKARRVIIKDYYAQWMQSNPDRAVWNRSLGALIYVKNSSINEALGHAPKSVEATKAQLNLTRILSEATLVEQCPPKYGTKNQKAYSRMFLFKWKRCNMLAGFQKTKSEYVGNVDKNSW